MSQEKNFLHDCLLFKGSRFDVSVGILFWMQIAIAALWITAWILSR